MKKLVLASSSPQRKMLLERLSIPFHIHAPDVDETPLPHETAEQLVDRLAIVKAQAVAAKYDDAVIIGSDQVGTFQGQIYGKPYTYDNAFQQLKLVSGEVLDFYTGLCVMDTKRNEMVTHVEKFSIKFRQLDDAMIHDYLQREQPYQCAGSIQVEKLGVILIEAFIGTDHTALIGLPLIKLSEILRQHHFFA